MDEKRPDYEPPSHNPRVKKPIHERTKEEQEAYREALRMLYKDYR